jgi:16S rRNA (uracil1498-N3)-methyltransferase
LLAREARASLITFLTTEPSARPIATAFDRSQDTITLLIGPEGGWTADELSLFAAHKLLGLKLTDTILRVETAAVAAMAVLACFGADASNRRAAP